MLQEGTIYRAHFFDFFCDAGSLAIEASIEKKPHTSDTRIRASILNAMLSVEAAANCCLHALDFEQPFYSDMERLSTLAKFALFHKYRTQGPKFDRGHQLVQPVKNIIDCRNEYVHSKIVKQIWEKGAHRIKVRNPLGLPHSSIFWQPIHTVKVFTVVSDFP